MKLDDFVGKIASFYHSQPSDHLRYGQVVMNILSEFDPVTYKNIVGTEYDCFYDTGKVEILFDKLQYEWKIPEGSKSMQKRLEALQRLSELDQQYGLS